MVKKLLYKQCLLANKGIISAIDQLSNINMQHLHTCGSGCRVVREVARTSRSSNFLPVYCIDVYKLTQPFHA